MKNRKSPSIFHLDLDSLSSVLEIYPDTDLEAEVARYSVLYEELTASVKASAKGGVRDTYCEWLKLSDEEISHIRPKRGLCKKPIAPNNLIRMSADSHALASDWKNVGIDVSEAYEVLRDIDLRAKRKKDQEALKHG